MQTHQQLVSKRYVKTALLQKRCYFSERTVELVLTLDECDGLTWIGISGRKLEPLTPKSVQVLEFKAVPLLPGMRSLSGIKLLDTFLKRTYVYDDIAQVFVVIDRDGTKA